MSGRRLPDLWVSPEGEKPKPTVSFELFPARDEKAAKKLTKVITQLAALEPDFVSVTFGAGGSTRSGSFQLAETLKHEHNLTVLPYLAAYGLSPGEIAEVLDGYTSTGIDSIFCVRGDEPESPDFKPAPDSFPHASDLLDFVRETYSLFCGAAGYPEGHKDAESLDKDLEYVKLKVQNGARFIISQYVYDNRFFFDFTRRCRGIGIDVPILAGIMPIYSEKMTKNLATICGATVTHNVKNGLAALPTGDKDAVAAFGADFAYNQCRELLEHGVDGIHFYTMDRAKTIARVVGRLRNDGYL